MNARLLVRSSLLIAVFFGINKVVALARSIIVARVFGVSPLLDAFNIANNLPDLLFTVISGGALAMAFIPVLADTFDTKGRAAGWEVFSLVANLAFVVTGVFAVVIAIFAEPIVTSEIGIAPGFGPEQQALVVDLMRLNLIATLIFSISGLVIGGLQANNHFLLTVLAPILYNVGQIFGALVLSPAEFPFVGLPIPTFDMGVYGLVYGVILGALLHLVIQVPGLFYYGFRWTPAISLKNPAVLQVIALMAPRILALGAFQYSELFRDNLASRLDDGSVTALSLGWFIQQVPQTLIGTAIGTALLPTLSMLVAHKETDALRRTMTAGVRAMIVLTVPTTVISWLLVLPAVQLVFEGGAFLPEDTPLVVFAAQMYLLGLMGHSLLEMTNRAYYANRNAVTPTVVAMIAMAAQIGLALWWVSLPRLGYAGLALANSAAYTLQPLILLVLLARTQAYDVPNVMQGTVKAVVASAGMGLAVWGVLTFVGNLHPIIQLGAGGVVGGGVFLLLAWLLKLEELQVVPLMLRRVVPALDASPPDD